MSQIKEKVFHSYEDTQNYLKQFTDKGWVLGSSTYSYKGSSEGDEFYVKVEVDDKGNEKPFGAYLPSQNKSNDEADAAADRNNAKKEYTSSSNPCGSCSNSFEDSCACESCGPCSICKCLWNLLCCFC